jgi:hypothetical protein
LHAGPVDWLQVAFSSKGIGGLPLELDEVLLEELLDELEPLDELVIVESPLELLVELVEDSPLLELPLLEVLDEPLDETSLLLVPPLLDDAEPAAGMPLGKSMPHAAMRKPSAHPLATTT